MLKQLVQEEEQISEFIWGPLEFESYVSPVAAIKSVIGYTSLELRREDSTGNREHVDDKGS